LRLDRDEAPPRSGRLRLVILVLLLAALGAGYVFGWPYLAARIFKPEVQATEILNVSPAQASVTLTSSGYVIAQTVSDVGPVVAGRIKRIDIKEGDQVKQGQVIAILDNADRQAALSAARSGVTTAKARADVARAELEALEIKAKRERALVKQGVSAAASADDLEAQVAALKKNVAAAEASVKAAGADVRNLKVNLDYMTVTAPIDGIVLGKPAGVGAMVGPFVGAIAKLVDLKSLVVETDVPEARLSMVKLEGPCEILLDAFPGRRLRGEVQQVGPRVDRAKATVTVKVKFVDEPSGVLPEMAARVNFLSEKLDEKSMNEKPKVVVPASAITERAGAKVVFVLDDGRVRMRSVALGAPMANGFELTEGPPAGTRVVRDPPPELSDGREVKESGK
jgi:RND family efflux transporter MFP subunit